MSVQRNATRPVGITNSSGEPEIVLEIDGLTISMTPPGRPELSAQIGGVPAGEIAEDHGGAEGAAGPAVGHSEG